MDQPAVSGYFVAAATSRMRRLSEGGDADGGAAVFIWQAAYESAAAQGSEAGIPAAVDDDAEVGVYHGSAARGSSPLTSLGEAAKLLPGVR